MSSHLSIPPLSTVREGVKPENTWYLRHEATLRRWPVLHEPWAQALEQRLVDAAAHRRSPGRPIV